MFVLFYFFLLGPGTTRAPSPAGPGGGDRGARPRPGLAAAPGPGTGNREPGAELRGQLRPPVPSRRDAPFGPPGPAEPRCGAGRSGPPCAPASFMRHALPFSFYFFFFSLFFNFSSLSLSLHPFLFALRCLRRFPLFGGWRQVAADTERRLGAHRSPAAHLEASHSPSPGNPGAPAPAVPRPLGGHDCRSPGGRPVPGCGAPLRRRGARSPRGVLRRGLSSRGCWAPGNWINS